MQLYWDWLTACLLGSGLALRLHDVEFLELMTGCLNRTVSPRITSPPQLILPSVALGSAGQINIAARLCQRQPKSDQLSAIES